MLKEYFEEMDEDAKTGVLSAVSEGFSFLSKPLFSVMNIFPLLFLSEKMDLPVLSESFWAVVQDLGGSLTPDKSEIQKSVEIRTHRIASLTSFTYAHEHILIRSQAPNTYF